MSTWHPTSRPHPWAAAQESCPTELNSTPPQSVPLTGEPGGWLASAWCCGDGAGSASAMVKGQSSASVSCSPVLGLWGTGCRGVPHTRDQGSGGETEAGSWVRMQEQLGRSPLG